MTQNIGLVHHIERDASDVSGVKPARVYLEAHPTKANTYVIGDSKASQAAYLGDYADSPGTLFLFNSAAQETHQLMMVGGRVIATRTASSLSPMLTSYVPGGALTLTRSTIADDLNASGVYVQRGVNVARDSHYIGGVRTLLLESDQTNVIISSSDQTNAAWVKGFVTAAQNAVGLEGAANTATTLTKSTTATSAANSMQSVTVTANTQTHVSSVWIRKDSDTTRFPMIVFFILDSGGSAVAARGIRLDTSTGATALEAVFTVGTVTYGVVDKGLWWMVWGAMTNTGSGVTLRTTLYPARATTISGAAANAAVGSIIVGNAQSVLNSSFPTSPIFTSGTALARRADSASLAGVTSSRAPRLYQRYYDLSAQAWVDSDTAYTSGSTITFTNDRAYAGLGVFHSAMTTTQYRTYLGI